MDYMDNGVIKHALGFPTAEEIKRLKAEGYILIMSMRLKPSKDIKSQLYQIYVK